MRRVARGLLVALAAVVFFALLGLLGVMIGVMYAIIAAFCALAIWAA